MWDALRLINPFQGNGYTPLGNYSLPSSHRIGTYLKITTAVSIVVLLAFLLHPLSAAESYGLLLYHHRNAIPSIVHYVYIKKEQDSVIDFPFAHFLTLYASVLYIWPSRIFIHSDYNASEIAEAAATGSPWTRKVLNFSDIVQWNHVQAPEFAGPNENTRISAIQHKSDFIRWEQIVKTGGIYMDWDVVPLRPLTPLLNAGFAFIAGRQYGGKDEGGQINGTINNGAFMTRPNSAMARIMLREQTAGFNGAWEYNLQFLTSLAERLVSIPGEVLICDRNAFAPTHWFFESKDALFLPNDGLPSPEPKRINSTNPLVLYDNMVANRRNRRGWEMDFSATYMLHAFGQGQYNEWITPKKILERKSNYGIATWAIVKRMVEEGVVTGEEDD
ncbi:hypothetical protein BU26DRAFT_152148 [Trematosphaeria pertusa]|uniref:Glycosyltransferase family 32 protein n=1 Tax=Trematosphaeria pertusa TaxID=390896 RepID=A0A6A6IXI2_9PLEO|nr:uncharacterized protein BU26DRAFT_152148 [Trematosphaeria pertusa]KAF2255199.1 hypothetical protein BU26DRAFT_152148 [Trematosphaeria pertusa]